jgi:uncharacterized membrane protein
MLIQHTIEILAPPKRVWDVMIDVERWPEWTSSVTSVELLDGSPLRIGSRARIRQPRLAAALWTVTTIEPLRYYEWRSVLPGLTSIGGHRIEALGDERCRVVLSVEWKGVLAPLINLIYGDLSRRYVATEAEGLKRRAEADQEESQ